MKNTSFFKRVLSAVFAIAFVLTAIPTVEAQAATDVKVHFKNVPGWSTVCTYTWGEGDLFGSWPGSDITATADADGYYTATLDAYPGEKLNIIFNNGNNGDQTVDLVCNTVQSSEWWVVPTNNGSGKWECAVAVTKADAEAGKSTPLQESKPLIPENPTIKESPVVKGNEVTFYFESEIATNIVISGSMNEWSTDWTMSKDGNVFSYTATIPAGEYQYKYIVDGEWMTDPFNPNTVEDENGNTNSSFKVTATGDTKPEDTKPEDTKPEDTKPEDEKEPESESTTPSDPQLPENPTVGKSPVVNGDEVTFYFVSDTATNIVISGSMNNWTTDWTMTKDGNVFSYTATIVAGTYQYKYIVDGEWMTDPLNPNTADDGSGNINSTFEVTATGTTPDAAPDATPDTEVSTEGASTENTTTEDDAKDEAATDEVATDDTQDTQTSDDVKDDAQPGGLPTGVIIAIAAVATVLVVVGGFVGFTYFNKKKAE